MSLELQNSLFLAFSGFGVWSLVAKMLTQELSSTFFYWLYNKWYPSLLFSRQSFRELFSFGSRLLLANILYRVFDNVYIFVIAKYFAADTVGFYTKAKSFNSLTAQNLNSVISRVSFPVLASISDDDTKLKAGYKKILKIVMFMSCFMMLFVAISSEALVLTLLGENWLKTATFLSIMSYSAMLYPLHSLNLNMLNVKGRSDLYLRITLVKRVLVVPAVLTGINFGITPMLYVMLGNSIVAYFINSYYSGKLIEYSVKEQLTDIFPAFGVAAFSAVLAKTISTNFVMHPSLTSFLHCTVMFCSTIFVSETIKLSPYIELKKILFERLSVFGIFSTVKSDLEH